jgi:hypothetical protein
MNWELAILLGLPWLIALIAVVFLHFDEHKTGD